MRRSRVGKRGTQNGELRKLSHEQVSNSGKVWRAWALTVLVFIVMLSFVALAYAIALNFTAPTLSDNSYTANNYTIINMSITEENLSTFKFNWNSTNYTFYDDSLVLALNFNNNSAIGENSTYAVDISKYRNNGTLGDNISSCSGGFCPNFTSSGRFGGAYEFDGVDDYVNCSNDESLNISFEITIAMWIYPLFDLDQNATKSNITVCERVLPPDNIRGYLFGYLGSVLRGWFGAASNGLMFSANIPTPLGGTNHIMAVHYVNLSKNNWHHLAATYNNSTGTKKLYINGQEVNNDVDVGGGEMYEGVHDTVAIGRDHGGVAPFNGTIDEVRIYNRTLSAEEIWMHYQSEFSRYNSTEYRFYSNITNLSDGQYQYYGWGNNTTGSPGQSETRTLIVDTIPSQFSINLTSPPNNTNTTDNTPDFNFTVSGNKANYSCELLIDEIGYGKNESTQNGTETVITANPSLSDGTYNWRINCTAIAGDAKVNSSETRTLTVETGPPTITIHSPQNNTTYNNATIDLNVSANEAIISWWHNLNNGGNVSFTPNTTITAVEESNTLVVWANDTVGNENSSSVTFTVDTTPPTITIHSPQNNTTYNNATVDLNVSANEAINSWWYDLNNVGNASFAPNTIIPAIEGSNTLVVWANDTVGMENNSSVTFTVDTAPPTITVLPPTNTTYTTHTIWFNATANETVSSWIANYNGTNVTLASINTSLTVEDGSHHLLLYGYDSAGNWGLNDTINFTVDTTPPKKYSTGGGGGWLLIPTPTPSVTGTPMIESTPTPTETATPTPISTATITPSPEPPLTSTPTATPTTVPSEMNWPLLGIGMAAVAIIILLATLVYSGKI